VPRTALSEAVTHVTNLAALRICPRRIPTSFPALRELSLETASKQSYLRQTFRIVNHRLYLPNMKGMLEWPAGHCCQPLRTGSAARSSVLRLLFCGAAIAAFAAETPPKVPDHVVLKPTFMTGYDSFSGGTAFVCQVPDFDGMLILTAHHLFGSACGLAREFTWQELPKTFVAVTGLSMSDPTRYVTSVKPLTIPGAHGLDGSGYHNDLAGYRNF